MVHNPAHILEHSYAMQKYISTFENKIQRYRSVWEKEMLYVKGYCLN